MNNFESIESLKASIIEFKNKHAYGLLESTYDYMCSLFIFYYFAPFGV